MQSYLWTSFNPEVRKQLENEAKLLISPFDLHLKNCANEGGIESIRELQHFLSQKPTQGEFNLALLTEAQDLTVEAQNALLKILEEPPVHSQIILIATTSSQLLPTIVSRVQLREENSINPTKKIDWELVQEILMGTDGQRLNLAETLDLSDWLQSWEQILVLKVNLTPSPLVDRLTLAEIYTYLKKLATIPQFQFSHVNSKLLAYNVILSAPHLI